MKIWLLLGIIVLISFASAGSIYNDLNIRENDLYNITNTNSSYFYGDGSGLTNLNTTNTTYNLWAYNQTIPANIYSDNLNITQASWVDNLFVRFTELVSQIGNWTLDKPSYSTTSEANNLYVNLNGDTFEGNMNIGNYNLTNANKIEANILDGVLSWNNLTNYPIKCPEGTYVTQIGDSITCSTINYTTFSVNNSDLWNGNTWSDYRWLNIDGSNANQNIDIGSYDFLTSGDISANWFKGKFNWTTDDWHSFNGYNLTFNESKLSSIYYSPTQSEIIRGTLDGGNITLIQHPDRHYDDITLNISEVSGSPGLDVRINITNVDDFNRGVLRYKTSSLSGDYPIRQLWNYDTSTWEDYPPIGEITTFLIVTEPIFDSSSHLRNGTVQMRIYKASNGNTNNHYYIDWFALVKGYGTPAGQEADPYSFHTDKNLDNTGFNITASTGFFEFLGSLTNKIAKIFTTDIEISGKINLTNGTYNSQIYLDENGTTNIIGQNGVFKIY